jgi:hypothetical protein
LPLTSAAPAADGAVHAPDAPAALVMGGAVSAPTDLAGSPAPAPVSSPAPASASAGEGGAHASAGLPAEPARRRPTRRSRALLAALLLLAVYAALSFVAMDPRGTLGTDTGAKLATLHMMEHNGGLDPDLGYWAERLDPEGALHPLHYTYDVGGKWVSITTLPMLVAAYPLYLVGGDRAVLLLPMLGALLCAFGARALVRRVTPDDDGWRAFWVVGLASPVAVYALDFWEHTVGLGLMLWAVVCLLDVLDRRPGRTGGWFGALVAGFLFGAAATMRTESLVYLVVATGLTCAVMLWRERRLVRPLVTGALALVGAFAALAANRLLEQALLGTDLRGSRAAGTVSSAGASLGLRVREALTTAVGTGMSGLRPSTAWLVGVVAVALVALGAWGLLSRDRVRIALGAVAFAVACVVYLARFEQGWGYVPGLFAASPFAAVGVVLAWRRPALRLPAVIACAALPVAWAVQYQGGADPQWGGRYLLLSGTILAVAGCVVLRHSMRAFVAVLVLASMITAAGVAWLSVRSHTVADGMETIVARHDQLVISRQTHLWREGGAFYDARRRWLTATTPAELRAAARLAGETGVTELALVGGGDQAPPAELGPYTRGRTELVPFVRPDVLVQVTTYRRG